MLKRVRARMRTVQRLAAFAAFLGVLATAPVAPAQEAGSVTVEVGECRSLPSPEERLACYEARDDAELQRRESAPDAAAAESSTAAAESSAVALPAETPTAAPRTESPAAAAAPESPAGPAPTQTVDPGPQEIDRSIAATGAEPRDIFGTVAALRETVPKRYMITLEDGQVWRQTYPERYPLRVGQRVTLRPTRWGDSWRLSAEGLEGYGYIQVERVR